MRDEGLLSLGGGGYSVSALFPQCPYEVCEALIVALGDALEAHFAQWSPWYGTPFFGFVMSNGGTGPLTALNCHRTACPGWRTRILLWPKSVPIFWGG